MMPTEVPPAVTIVILNYQRKDVLSRVVQSALCQDYPDLEVVVVDNASTDGSAPMVAEHFPAARLVQLPVNIGCAARNHGVAVAKGQIVVTLDNDVLLATPDAIRTVADLFARYPSVACIDFKILDAAGNLSTRDWCHPRDWRHFADDEFYTAYVLEGAAAFRRQAFEQVGGYWASLFLGHEGHDLAYRLLEAGYDLLYSPRVRVTHLVSAVARPASRIYYTFTRNSIWVSLRNHRPLPAARAIARDIALMAFSSARSGHVGSYLHGLWDGLRGSPHAFSSRRPLGPAAYRKLRCIRSFEPSLFSKLRRHIRERPI